MAKFSLVVESFTPPTLPCQSKNASSSVNASSLVQSPDAATSPLRLTVRLPSALDTDLLYPATHLQLSYAFSAGTEIFAPAAITSRDIMQSGGEYLIQSPPGDIPRAKVKTGMTSAAGVRVHAWRGDKLLGTWVVGRIEGLGITDVKQLSLPFRRQQAAEEMVPVGAT
ncbi:hypothetical protein AAL_01309 [Moelleriella libera RCEF 2490]|uniref:Uncharacterized protein n=1 Tax=Moelleriella libera RCEF 2490 TaxID=1081109 RepID=A0A166U2R0_9HYPO|nr:hypothetical protein AAL_01309 [Moelleriella libera RCEF 2490]